MKLLPPSDPAARKAFDYFQAQQSLSEMPRILGEGLDFRGASFKRLNAVKSDFFGAILDEVDFSEGVLSLSEFGRASARRATFTDCALVECEFQDAILDGAVMRRASAQCSYWFGTSAVEADFEGAELYEGSFFRATLTRANLTATNLNLASFEGCRLFGARFDGATGAVMVHNAADVGEGDPELLKGEPLLEWFHKQGGTELTAYVAPSVRPE